MACPVVSTITYSQPHEAVGNRGSKCMQLEGNPIETSLGSDNKGLKSRVVVVLSNTFRNVAIIETTRFLAIIGLVCSAATSVLLPALGFAFIAASACVLKNRVIQLDEKPLKDSDVTAGEVFDQTLTRSASTVSRTSQGSDLGGTMIGEDPIRSTTSMAPIIEEIRGESPTDVQEAFLNSWGKIDSLNIEDLHGLLAICYSYLCRKNTEDMPKSLSRKGLLKDPNTQTYFERKFKDCLAKTSEGFKGSVTLDSEGRQIPAVNEKQKPLEKADPSLTMETVQELHRQISQEQHKHGNKTEEKHHADNAKHAGEYAAQLKTFEFQKGLHFAEDVNNLAN